MAIKLLNIIIIFQILLIQISYSKSNTQKTEKSQVIIYSGLLGNPYDDDSDAHTYDKNCNKTEYPEQAIRCQNITMKCEDTKYLHHCSCLDGYITFPYPEDTYTFCSYKQKKQLIPFLLELCAPFGAGHFYRYDFIMGSFKFICFALGITFICTFPKIARFIANHRLEGLAIFISIIYYLYITGLAFWYIWDLVYFASNNYKDYTYQSEIGQGIELQPW